MPDKKQVMDVSKPGKVAPSASSRPIIINHGSILKDPMVSEGSSEASEKPVSTVPVAQKPHVAKVIEPPKAESSDKQTESSKDKEPSTKDAVPPEEPSQSAEDNPEQAPKDEDNEAAVVDAVVDQATLGKAQTQKEVDKESLERQQKVAALIEEKKYNLPVKPPARVRSGRYALVAVVALAVVLLGGYAAVDAGVVKAGFDVPVHFLKKKATTATELPVVTPAVTAPNTTAQAVATLATYTNKDLGLQFSYPQEWGDVALSTEKSNTETGKRVLLTFSKQPKAVVGLMSKDWKDPIIQDVAMRCKEVGFTVYPKLTTDLDNGRRVVSSTSTKQVVEWLQGGMCDDTELNGYIAFSKNTAYVGAEFRYADKVTDKFDLAQRIADYKKNYDKYFPTTLRQQITNLTTSFTEL